MMWQSYCFHVDKVFGADRTTETIYEDIVKPLLPWVLQGRVSTLFAYGQTGSGKTFTVSGLEQLIATSLFDSAKEGQKKIQICIVELAGNSAYGESFTILTENNIPIHRSDHVCNQTC